FHILNTPQPAAERVFDGSSMPRRYIGAGLTDEERYLLVSAAHATSGNGLYVKDLAAPTAGFVTVVGDMDKNHEISDSDGSKLFIYTELDAPNGRVVTVDVANPKPENWQTLIAETEQALSPTVGGGKIFANYLKDAASLVKQY